MKQMNFYEDPSLVADVEPAAEISLVVNTEHTPEIMASPAKGNVTEIIVSPEQAENIQMLLPMMTQLNQDNRWLAWIDPPQSLLNRWQSQNGIIASQIMILRSTETKSALDLTEQALSAGTCHAVVAWTNKLSREDYTRLETASAKGTSHGVVMRYR